MSLYSFARPLLFALDAETAHGVALRAIELAYRTGLSPLLASKPTPRPRSVFGIDFPNPVGLAAGLDKNGAYIDALAALGFGFLEIGTVTPRPQPGNPRPRVFRLPEHQAVINRLGFNNDGIDALLKNLDRARFRGVLGINIGKNQDTPKERAAEDYLTCLRAVHERASYVTVNISSPNTRGLRDLQERETLRRLIGRLRELQERLGSQGRRKPMLLKIAPDLDDAALDAIAEVVLTEGIDGLICTNTTIERPLVMQHRFANQAGGLSGAPLFAASTAVLTGMVQRTAGKLPIIGVGGILSGADARAKFAAGAVLVQCYTGLIFRGPELIGECVDALCAEGTRR